MNIREQIRRYLAQNFLFSDNDIHIDDDASFLEEGIVDSTGVLELVLFVEETFGVQIKDAEIVPDNFDTVSSLAVFVRQKVALNS